MGLTNQFFSGELLKEKVPQKAISFFSKMKFIQQDENVDAVLASTSLGAFWEGIVVTDRQVAFFTHNSKVNPKSMSFSISSITGVSIELSGKGLMVGNRISISLGGSEKVLIPIMAQREELNRIYQCIIEKTHGKNTEKPSSTSPADEIMKYKSLFDAGAITQDEFEAKKKQLLGL